MIVLGGFGVGGAFVTRGMGFGSVAPTVTKAGGDDVPRIEIWEGRKSKRREKEELEKIVYIADTGRRVIEEFSISEIHEPYDEDEEEILLLMH